MRESNGEPVLEIGFKLREGRRRKGYTQAELAEIVGVTKGFISQLENNTSQVSVAKLLRICRAVDVEIGTLFSSRGQQLVRKSARTELELGGYGVRDFLLTPPDRRDLQIIQAELEPLAHSGDEPYALDCDVENVAVSSGVFELELEDTAYVLNTGDSITFDGGVKHSWRNPSAVDAAVVIWTLTKHR